MCDGVVFFFFKQKTAYEIVSRDWSSDVCSSDLDVSIRGQFISIGEYEGLHERNTKRKIN